MKLLHYFYVEKEVRVNITHSITWKNFVENFVEDGDRVFKHDMDYSLIYRDFEPCCIVDNVHLDLNGTAKYLLQNSDASYRSWYTEVHELAHSILEGYVLSYCLRGTKQLRIFSSADGLHFGIRELAVLIGILSECVKDVRRDVFREVDYKLTLFLNGALLSIYDYKISDPYHVTKKGEIFIQSPENWFDRKGGDNKRKTINMDDSY